MDDPGDEIDLTRDKIRSAFAHVPRPDPDRLLDPARWAGEAKGRRDFRRGGWRHWWDVPPDVLGRNPEALVRLASEALWFYLPAYMTFALDGHDSGESSIGLLLVVLTPGQKAAARRAFEARFGNLDGRQRDAIASFLRLWRDRLGDDLDANQARIALERHWGP
ncbi:MAG: hypothetical protein NVSMB9_36480 [Isosphaeraceae bacterium]